MPAHTERPAEEPPAVLAPPVGPPALRVPAHRTSATPAATTDEIEEIDDGEVMEVSDDAVQLLDDGAPAEDQVHEADELEAQAVEAGVAHPPSAIDPWFAQLVHGYCPPESHLFDRHTPPTTMPGRDTPEPTPRGNAGLPGGGPVAD